MTETCATCGKPIVPNPNPFGQSKWRHADGTGAGFGTHTDNWCATENGYVKVGPVERRSMQIYEYQHAHTGKVHLSRQMNDGTTLCGRPTRHFRQGDESPSGIGATCGTCRKLAGLR